eukprot:Nk52_evm66s2657 gene=Nk52_evmTU66s2657
MSVEIQFGKADKVYRYGDTVAGVVIVSSQGILSHSGLSLKMSGVISFSKNSPVHVAGKTAGVMATMNAADCPIPLVTYSRNIELPSATKLPSGKTEIPFSFKLIPNGDGSGKDFGERGLFETYHGVYINIIYAVQFIIQRTMLSKDISKSVEFIVEARPNGTIMRIPIPFTMSKETILQNLKKSRASSNDVPEFCIEGRIDSAECDLTKPFTGELIVRSSSQSIKSIEIQLVRVETCSYTEGFTRDPTEVQNIQIADGNVCFDVPLPLYMIFPRFFTCLTFTEKLFKIEFEVNIVLLFSDNRVVSENFPITLCRPVS